jgi:hypothetical protein
VVLRGEAQTQSPKGGKAKPVNVSMVQASAPILITVQLKQAAVLNISPSSPTLAPGKETEVTIKVSPKEFGGKCRIELIVPAKAKGISAEELVIPAGKTEGRLIVKAAADASPGLRPNLVIKATGADKDGASITQEAKFTIMVSK